MISETKFLLFPKIITFQIGRHRSLLGGRRRDSIKIQRVLQMRDFLHKERQANPLDIQDGPVGSKRKGRSQRQSRKRRNVSVKYKLFAVVLHTGWSPGAGHYTVAVQNTERTGGWWMFNDSKRTLVADLEGYGRNVYLLFYEKRL